MIFTVLLSAATEQASEKQMMIKLSVLILGMMSSISAQTAWHKGWSRGQAEEEWKYWLLAAAISPDTGDAEHSLFPGLHLQTAWSGQHKLKREKFAPNPTKAVIRFHWNPFLALTTDRVWAVHHCAQFICTNVTRDAKAAELCPGLP